MLLEGVRPPSRSNVRKSIGSRGFPIPVASIVRDAVDVERRTDVDHNVDLTGQSPASCAIRKALAAANPASRRTTPSVSVTPPSEKNNSGAPSATQTAAAVPSGGRRSPAAGVPGGSGCAGSSKRPREHEREEQRQGRDQDHGAVASETRSATSVASPAAACSTVRPGRICGRCASAHPATIAADRDARPTSAPAPRAGARRAATSPLPPRTEATSATSPAPEREPVVESARRRRAARPARRAPARRRRAASRARAPRNASRQVAPVGARRVGGQVHGGQVGAGGDRERADDDRRRVQPARRSGRRPRCRAGTRPDAMPPIAAPSANGVRTDESAEQRPERPAPRATLGAAPRSA